MNLEALRARFEQLRAIVEQLIEKAQSGGNTDELEAIIDNSGVLESTEGTTTDKVEQLLDRANIENHYYQRTSSIVNASDWFTKFNGEKLPRSNLVKATVVVNFANRSTIVDVDYYLNWGAEATATINASNAFADTANLTHMVGARTGRCYNMANFFVRSAIEEIDEPFDLSAITQSNYLNGAFGCSNLREIRFFSETIKYSVAFTSAVLSAESIQSIIDGLATVETMQTLTLNSTVTANLTAEQMIQIANKNWTTG